MEILELAEMKKARSYFSLLMRAALNGTDGVAEDELVALQKNLRKNFKILLKSPMSSSRKAICLSFAISRNLTNGLISAGKKIVG